MNKHNFTREAVRAKAQYRLWVKYHKRFVSATLPEIKIYYSYDKAGNPNYGKHKLEAMVKRNREKMEKVILYDNHSGKEVGRY